MVTVRQRGLRPHFIVYCFQGPEKDIAERVRSSRGGIDWLGEQEVLAQLRKHLLDEGLETTAAEDVIDNLRFFQKTGACYDPATIAEAAVEAESRDSSVAVVEGLEEDGSPKFFVSISLRSKLRCVHRVNGCWREPGLNI